MDLTRAHAEALDAEDPLAAFRERFVIAEDGPLYLDGNSLGRLPIATRERLATLTDQWGSALVSGWPEWIDAPRRAGDAIAPLIGARPGEVLACDSVTVNLFKLCGAVLDADRLPYGRALVTDARNFPTDRYVLEGLCRRHDMALRLFDSDPVEGVRPEELERALEPGGVPLVVLSHVDYRSGAVADVRALTAIAHRHDARVVWDLSHSAGAAPADLVADGAELAVGCTYKYLNAGPGAPGWLYVRHDLQPRLRSPIWGWFGQDDQFDMDREYTPAPDITRFMAGTPTILGLAAVEEGARLTAAAGMAAIRAKSERHTALLVALADAWLAPLGFTVASPRDPARRGSHVTVRHPQAWPICRALVERAAVVPDFRRPDGIRLASAPLFTRATELWDAMDRLRRLVEAGEHELVDARPARVT